MIRFGPEVCRSLDAAELLRATVEDAYNLIPVVRRPRQLSRGNG